MVDNTLKKTEDLTKAFVALEKAMKSVEKSEKKTLADIDRKAQLAQKSTNDLTKSFETFNKVIEGSSASVFSQTLKDLPNYTKGISKLTSSYTKYNQEASKATDMLKTMGISFNKTVKELESKSSNIAKTMSELVDSANKFSSIRDTMASIPQKLKAIQDSMGALGKTKIKVGSIDKLTSLVDGLKGKISDVDFENIQGKVEKLGKGEGVKDLAEEIEKTLGNIKITSPIFGGEAIGKKAVEDINKELKTIGSSNPADDLATSFLAGIKEMRKDNNFSKLLGDNEKELADFEKAIKAPGATMEDTIKRMEELNNKLGPSFSNFFENFNKSSASASEALDEVNEGFEQLNDKFKKGYKLTFFTDEAVAQFQGVLSQMSANAFSIQANNIIPDDQLLKASEMQKALKDLVSLNEENKKIQQSLNSDQKLSEEQIAQITKDQEKNVKAIQKQVRYMKDLEKESESYSKNIMEASESGFGGREADGLRDKLFNISGSLKKIGVDMGTDSTIGKGLGGLGDLAGKFGGKLSALAFPIGVISGAISLGKMLLNIEGRYAKMSMEIVNTGALMGTSAKDVGAAMDNLNLKATNLSGLMEASMGGKEFALARGEILEVVNALNEAGMPARNLKESMAGVKTTAEGAGDAFVGASSMVAKFSYNLGISKGQVAGMMGEMSYEFGNSLGGINDVFTEMTASAAASNMSTNRFLATVQTATSGLALYEDQVSQVAKLIGKLGKDTNLTGGDMAKIAKNVMAFGENIGAVNLSISTMSETEREALQGSVDKDIAEAQKRVDELKKQGPGKKQELGRAEAELTNKKQFKADLTAGKDYQAAGNATFMSTEVKAQMMAKNVATIMDTLKSGGRGAMEQASNKFGIDPEVIKTMMGRGLSPQEIAQELTAKIGDPKDQQEKALAMDEKAGGARQKLLEAAKDTVAILTGKIAPRLYKLLAVVIGISGISAFSKLKEGGDLSGIADKLSSLGKTSVGDTAKSAWKGAKDIGGMNVGDAFNAAKTSSRGLVNSTVGAMLAMGFMEASLENVAAMIEDPLAFGNDMIEKYDARSLAEKLKHPIDTVTAWSLKFGDTIMDWLDVGGEKEAKKMMDDADKKLADKKADRLKTKKIENAISNKSAGNDIATKAIASKLGLDNANLGTPTPTGIADTTGLGDILSQNLAKPAAGDVNNNSNTNSNSNMNNVYNIYGGNKDEIVKVINETVYKLGIQR